MNQFIICFSNNTWYSLNLSNNNFKEELLPIHGQYEYITFQVTDFIRYLKSKKEKKVPKIIDLESLEKQFLQSGKDILGDNKWHILKTLRRYEIIDSNYKIDCIETFLHKIKDFYLKVISSNNEENKRYNSIEIRVNEIIHETSLKGIRIDNELVIKKCENLQYEIYKLKNIFQFEYNIFTPDKKET